MKNQFRRSKFDFCFFKFAKKMNGGKVHAFLYVVALVNNGASPNRKLFNLHVKLAIDRNCDVYKTVKSFSTITLHRFLCGYSTFEDST